MADIQKGYKRIIDEPNMSDKTLLMSVEDLISATFGSMKANTVNFKMMQTVLHILARHMRLLEQDVELKLDGIDDYGSDSSLSDRGAEYRRRAKERGRLSKAGTDGRGGRDKDRSDEEKKRRGDKTRTRQSVSQGRDDDDARRKGELDKSRKGRKSKSGDQDYDDGRRDKYDRDGGKKGLVGDDDEDDSGRGRGRRKDGRGRKLESGEDRKTRREDDYDGGRERKAKIGPDGLPLDSYDDEDEEWDKKSRKSGRQSLYVTEESRSLRGKTSKDKVLVVEKGPTTRADRKRPRVGSIDVVSASEFDLLSDLVKYLQTVAVPPRPSLPDNQKLMDDLAKGTATLPEAMQAMQLNSRIDAAENGLNLMAGLLTKMATLDVIPPEMALRLREFETEMRKVMDSTPTGGLLKAWDQKDASKTGPGRKDAAMTPSKTSTRLQTELHTKPPSSLKASEGSGLQFSGGLALAARLAKASPDDCVTAADLIDILQELQDEMAVKIKDITAKAMGVVEHAAATTKGLGDKLDVAVKLDDRISDLNALAHDYAEQLKGFDSGIATQMASFNEQLLQMHLELQAGLVQLGQASNKGSSVLVELGQRYEDLVAELTETRQSHYALMLMKKNLDEELSSLVQCVEILREQKADMDEVMDGLRDKADITRLEGLLNETDFEETKVLLDKRLDLCYEKFRRQDRKWREALKELSNIVKTKADEMQISSLKDFANAQLTEIQDKLRELYILLGEPKAAILARQLSQGAHCAPCRATALMFAADPLAQAPPALPSLPPRPGHIAREEPCVRTLDWGPLPKPDDTNHVCNRWVGGSHTLVTTENVRREKAEDMPASERRTKKYHGYGVDGKLYMMEEELLPCIECNTLEPGLYENVTNAAGDQAGAQVCHPILKYGENKSGDDGKQFDGAPDKEHIHVIDVVNPNGI